MNYLGHNSNTKTLNDFVIIDPETGRSTGRIKITDEIMRKYLVCKLDTSKPKGKDKVEVRINDSEVIGLKAVVKAGGTKSWYFEYKPLGSRITERHTFPAKFPEMNTKEARKLAKDLKNQIALGKNPKDIIAERTTAKTIGAIAEDWEKNILYKSQRFRANTRAHVSARLRTWLHLKPKLRKYSNKETVAHITKYHNELDIKSKQLKFITKKELIAYHNAITLRSPSQADRVIDDLQQVFNYAVEIGEVKENICRFDKDERNNVEKRMDTTRPFRKDEFTLIQKICIRLAAKNIKIRTAARALLLLAYTGRRKEEILSLKWGQVKMGNTEIDFTGKQTKNNEAFIVELLPAATALFKRLERDRKASSNLKDQYVFPATKKSKKPYLKNPIKTWKLIIGIAKKKNPQIEYKCIHMLRHTFACLLLEATNDIKLVASIMNWKSLKVAEVYADYLGRDVHKQGIKKLHKFLLNVA